MDAKQTNFALRAVKTSVPGDWKTQVGPDTGPLSGDTGPFSSPQSPPGLDT